MMPSALVAGHAARILIVDNERLNRQLLEAMLSQEGFHVQTAATGEEALAIVAAEPLDLILLDVMMPGMDSDHFARTIKGSHATQNIPVMMVGALDDHNARMLGLDAGAEDFLTTPIDRAELCVRVRNLLRLKTYSDHMDEYSQVLEEEVDSRTAEVLLLTEQERVREQQMRFKDEFLSHVSHELRSPLTAIKQFTSILLDGLGGTLTEKQRTYQQIVLKNTHQLQAMIDDLLEVTRLDNDKLNIELACVSVIEAVSDSVDTLQVTASAKGITLLRELPADLPTVHADETRLRQILIILLDNAIKFSPEGAAVTIQARLPQHDSRYLLLEVSDLGCGIPAHLTETIFERLQQAPQANRKSRNGLGLGLYICKELVTRLGGTVSVKSELDKGSTFSLKLPVPPCRAEARAQGAGVSAHE